MPPKKTTSKSGSKTRKAEKVEKVKTVRKSKKVEKTENKFKEPKEPKEPKEDIIKESKDTDIKSNKWFNINVQLPKLSFDILDSYDEKNKKNIKIGCELSKPEMQLGFNYMYHQNKNLLENREYQSILKKYFRYKNIVNPFEHINKYEKTSNDICQTALKKYSLGTKTKPAIPDRAFFKIIEIYKDHNLLSKFKGATLKTLHLAEAPGAFIYATSVLRDLEDPKNSKKDTYNAITLHNMIIYNKDLEAYYTKEKPQRYRPIKTVSFKEANRSEDKCDGDLCNIKTHSVLEKEFKESKNKVDIITADGGFDPVLENYCEQESSQLLLGEIYAALNAQNKGGHFIIKFFDMFTTYSLKMLAILDSFYESVIIHKPYMSRITNAERYVIAKKFKYSGTEKEFQIKLGKIKHIFETTCSLKRRGYIIQDIIDENISETKLFLRVKEINKDIANIQYESVLNKVKFFHAQNFDGSYYNEYLTNQKNATKFWIKTYL